MISPWLCIDLSQQVGSLALFEEAESPRLIDEIENGSSFQHSEKFIDTLKVLLKRNNITLNDVARVLCTSGPGSFTGLRVAYSSLKAFSLVRNIPIDFMWAPEVRAIMHVLQTMGLLRVARNDIRVTTQLSASQWGVSEFSVASKNPLRLTLEKEFISTEKQDTDILPIRAQYLGLSRPFTQMVTEIRTPSDILKCEPVYFGSKY